MSSLHFHACRYQQENAELQDKSLRSTLTTPPLPLQQRSPALWTNSPNRSFGSSMGHSGEGVPREEKGQRTSLPSQQQEQQPPWEGKGMHADALNATVRRLLSERGGDGTGH